MADQVPVYAPDGNIIGYASTKEISEGLHVQRVLPSDEAGTTLALATSAKQDTAKGVLDARGPAVARDRTVVRDRRPERHEARQRARHPADVVRGQFGSRKAERRSA